MAINHADGMMFVAVPFYPIAAALGAAHAGAGWRTALFVPAGLALGLGLTYVGRRLVYSVTGFGLSRSSRIPQHWLQTALVAPFFVLYLFLPLAIAWGGVFGVWRGSMWLVRYIP